MELELDGKIALVTGGSKGIGRATALALLGEGASVLVCARGRKSLEETRSLAEAAGGARLVTHEADLSRQEDIKKVVSRCVEEFGTIDILINNAGSARPGPFLEIPDGDWVDDWTLKFFGYVRMAREVLSHMEQAQHGVIVNVIGTGGLRPMANYMVGGAANAGLNHFTKALAAEGAKHGVRVVGINPGPILTDRLEKFLTTMSPDGRDREDALRKMTPLGRVGEPEEVADLVLFLSSSRAAFIHGANITIDGGANPGIMG